MIHHIMSAELFRLFFVRIIEGISKRYRSGTLRNIVIFSIYPLKANHPLLQLPLNSYSTPTQSPVNSHSKPSQSPLSPLKAQLKGVRGGNGKVRENCAKGMGFTRYIRHYVSSYPTSIQFLDLCYWQEYCIILILYSKKIHNETI